MRLTFNCSQPFEMPLVMTTVTAHYHYYCCLCFCYCYHQIILSVPSQRSLFSSADPPLKPVCPFFLCLCLLFLCNHTLDQLSDHCWLIFKEFNLVILALKLSLKNTKQSTEMHYWYHVQEARHPSILARTLQIARVG